MTKHRIFTMSFASVYPLYIKKVERKGRAKSEVDQVIAWLTGYENESLERVILSGRNFEEFFELAPALNPNRHLITGKICGINIAEIEDPLMKEIRYLDKLIDELANGKAIAKILREKADQKPT